MKNFFSWFFAILYTFLAGVVVYAVAHSIGIWYVGVLRNQDGFVSSNDIVSYKWVVPGVLAFMAALLVFALMKGRDE